SADLKARLQALQDQKKTAWPSGNSLDEIAASVDAVSGGAKTLIADAQALKSKNALDADIAALRIELLAQRGDVGVERVLRLERLRIGDQRLGAAAHRVDRGGDFVERVATRPGGFLLVLQRLQARLQVGA